MCNKAIVLLHIVIVAVLLLLALSGEIHNIEISLTKHAKIYLTLKCASSFFSWIASFMKSYCKETPFISLTVAVAPPELV